MKFCILRSGSSGNCTYIEQGETGLLLDAGGVSKRKLLSLLSELGRTLEWVRGLVVTHLHSDHVGPLVLRACRAHAIPIWVHHQNAEPLRRIAEDTGIEGLDLRTFNGEPFRVGGIGLRPFGVSHDAVNTTSGFVFHSADRPEQFVAYAADLGCFDGSLLDYFREAHTVIIESNHDADLLWKNPRRHFVNKRRVAGDRGHLSNLQAGNALVEIMRASRVPPRQVILCHLSRDNNTPQLAVETVTGILGENGMHPTVTAALRDEKTAVFDL